MSRSKDTGSWAIEATKSIEYAKTMYKIAKEEADLRQKILLNFSTRTQSASERPAKSLLEGSIPSSCSKQIDNIDVGEGYGSNCCR